MTEFTIICIQLVRPWDLKSLNLYVISPLSGVRPVPGAQERRVANQGRKVVAVISWRLL